MARRHWEESIEQMCEHMATHTVENIVREVFAGMGEDVADAMRERLQPPVLTGILAAVAASREAMSWVRGDPSLN